METHFVDATRAFLLLSKKQGDGVLSQCEFDDLVWTPEADANSVAIIVRHMHGNMMSRFTDFLSSDGEKPWRVRDSEFDPPAVVSKDDVIAMWEEGWSCVANAVNGLNPEDLTRQVVIRGQSLSVFEALLRQVQHYGYHVGQMVTLARLRRGDAWKTLSIARGESKAYTPGPRKEGEAPR